MKLLRFETLAAAMLLLSAGAATAQECQRSKWGADDEIGAANLVTPERVLEALKLVKKGETHPLGIVIDPNMPAFPPRKMMLQVVQPNQQYDRALKQDFGWPIVYNDDVASSGGAWARRSTAWATSAKTACTITATRVPTSPR